MILDIDPKVDYAFKHFLGREETRPILLDVLNKVLNRTAGQQIQDIELLNPFNPKESFDDKLSILDIKARDRSGRQFNVEMQMLAQPSYPKRIFYYATKLHQIQLHEGDDYLQLKPTISISFINNELFPDADDCHLRFRLLEEKHHFALTDDIEFHILQLPKFTKTAEQLNGASLDIWLYFLRHAEKMDTEAVPRVMQQPLVLRALEDLRMLAQSDLERERYEARRKSQLDRNTDLKEARLIGRDEGRQDGIQEGRQEGRQEGKRIGVIQLCEQLLKRPTTSAEQLATLSLQELTRLADELQEQVAKQI